MIFPAILIALLLCAETEAGGTFKIGECGEWACFSIDKCVEEVNSVLYHFGRAQPINDDCSGIIMIKPYTTTKWEVVLGSKQTAANEVKLLQDSTELFSCKYDGTNAKATSPMEINEMESFPALPNACHLIIDGTSDVVQVKNVKIKITSDSPSLESTKLDDSFMIDVKTKLKCDMSFVQFEESSDTSVVAKAADVQLMTVSCSDPKSKLQYKSDSDYKEASSISCVKDTDNQYKYKIMPGDILKDGVFNARCAVKVCTLCTSIPKTPKGKTAPTITDAADGCKTLTCGKYFKIGDDITEEGKTGVCTKSDDDKYKWKIDGTIVKDTTEVECVDKKPCKKIASGCNDPCKLKEKDGLPYCPDQRKLSLKDGQTTHADVTVKCDESDGKLKYAVGNSTHDLKDDATFACADKVEAKANVASAGFGKMTALHVCLSIGFFLTLIIVGLSAFITIKKRMKDKNGKEGGAKKAEEK